MRILLFLVFLIFSTDASHALVFLDSTPQNKGITSQEESSIWAKNENFDPDLASVCNIHGLHVDCVNIQGDRITEYPIPVMPLDLLEYIQDGKVKDRSWFPEPYQLDFAEFSRNLTNFNFDNEFEFLTPLRTDWAAENTFVWIDEESDKTAKKVGEIWREIVEAIADQPLLQDGFFITKNEQGATKVYSACWWFFRPEDPFAEPCHPVLLERDGRQFARFVVKSFEGGYLFEPEYEFVCRWPSDSKNPSHVVYETVRNAFANRLELTSDERNLDRTQDDSFRIVLKKVAGASKLFVGYRELLDLRLSGIKSVSEESGSGQFSVTMTFSFAITKQNSANLSEITMPTEEQNKYYGSHLMEIAKKINGCA
ncbi:hypothetical protein D4A92_07660 [Rhizobium rosettiformans]|uniref:Tle cognate immunity protein 4 C-terminal domain-containing protein n=1 Tax=Rhizobium rosettiformans TaxID=1368430 RepID=A0ABX7EVP2_9HYPH|nr:hypothetical protein [Rhizobium rosettiformans]QRF51318.1 hypothetical protein D4A92_07660 [Rhizobium rosettiformans]